MTVTALSQQIRDTLRNSFGSVWVSGEISDLARPQSGHVYFSLKDDQSQLKAVIWRGSMRGVTFDLADGLEVICEGEVDTYAPRGTYQLIVRRIEPKGEGSLQLALRRMREKLAAEGLFDPARKRPLPRFPHRVVIVTSPTAAALHDFLQVARRRWPGGEYLVIPTRVQGAGACDEIAAAIAQAGRLRQRGDVLVVTRGGGSIEDLWSFNEEVVVRAIHASRIPVVSAVGHEIDVTLADLVADVRALTPSEAAERVVPSVDEVRTLLQRGAQRLTGALRGRAAAARAELDALATRAVLRRPMDRIHEQTRRVDELQQRQERAMRLWLQRHQDRLAAVSDQLESLNPLAVLARGYSVSMTEDGSIVRDASQLHAGQLIMQRYHRGQATTRVESVAGERDFAE
ncbi:MAG: exodeoxyribonuclease VII large subunit [Pirellulaceae bacterium]